MQSLSGDVWGSRADEMRNVKGACDPVTNLIGSAAPHATRQRYLH